MFEQTKFERKHSFYETNAGTKKYSARIPYTNSNKSAVQSYYDKIDNLVTGFEKNKMTNYDMYLINDALDVPNTRHKYMQELHDDINID